MRREWILNFNVRCTIITTIVSNQMNRYAQVASLNPNRKSSAKGTPLLYPCISILERLATIYILLQRMTNTVCATPFFISPICAARSLFQQDVMSNLLFPSSRLHLDDVRPQMDQWSPFVNHGQDKLPHHSVSS